MGKTFKTPAEIAEFTSNYALFPEQKRLKNR